MIRLTALLPALLLSGCLLDLSLPGERTSEVSETPDDWGTYETLTDIQFTEPHIRGDLGNVSKIDAPAFQADGQIYGDYTSITIRGQNETGVIMTMIDYTGDLATADTLADPSTVASAIGCSGPQDNYWETDVPAEDLRIQSVPGSAPNLVRVNVFATFGTAGQIDTSFEFDPNATVANP